jgi:hypothetical protein
MGLPFDHCIPPDEYTLEEGVPDLLSQGLMRNLNKAEYGDPLTTVGR